MSLNIKSPIADKLARDLSSRTGENITEAVIKALEERLERIGNKYSYPDLKNELLKIGKRCSELPTLDNRTPEEILGYDEHGLPTTHTPADHRSRTIKPNFPHKPSKGKFNGH